MPKYARKSEKSRKVKRLEKPENTGNMRKIKILFICHGNICRSTIAQSIFTYLVKQAGLENDFEIESAATSREEIGNPPHYGTAARLREAGIPLVSHRAVRMTEEDYDYYDYLIGMDSANIKNMQRIAGGDPDGKLHKLMEYAGKGAARDVADPWYTGDFEATYRDVTAGCKGLLECLKKDNKI